MADELVDVSSFDGLAAAEAASLARPVCASSAWVSGLVAGRPYGSPSRIADASDALVAALPWDGVLEALAAHPRIGDRPAGRDRESRWSQQEQSAAVGSAEVDASLTAANVAYEQKFGHVFLVCATGLSAQDVLDRANARLGNAEDVEQGVVRAELAAIARLRLAKVLR